MTVRPIIEKPRTNPVLFTQEGRVMDARYKQGAMLSTLSYNLTHWWQDKARYYHRWQNNNTITLQFHANTTAAFAGATIQLIGKSGVVTTWPTSATTVLAGNTETVTGNSQQLTTFLFQLPLYMVTIQPGYYFLRLKMSFDTDSDNIADTTVYEVSEPLYIKPYHRGTTLLEWTNDTNDYNTVFEQFPNLKYQMPVDGTLYKMKPDFEATNYQDQKDTVENLWYAAGRIWTFSVAGDRGVPDWMIDKVNCFLGMDHKFIEGVEYSLDTGSAWEDTDVDGYPLKGSSITLREADPDRATYTIANIPIVLYPAQAYPYAIRSLSMNNYGQVPYQSITLTQPRVIDSGADEAAFIAYLNTTVRSTNGLNGTFVFDSNGLSYVNGGGEFYNGYQRDIHNKYFLITRRKVFGSLTGSMTMTTSSAVVDWGDSTVAGYGNGGLFPVSPSHAYSFGGLASSWTIRIFHSDAISSFSTTDSQFNGIDGTLPFILNALSLQNGRLAVFDGAKLAACATNLRTITITGMPLLTSITNFGQVYTQLAAIDFSNNALTSAAVDAVITDFVVHANTIPSHGTMTVNNQTPAAPPSSTVLTSGAGHTLTAAPNLWNLLHD